MTVRKRLRSRYYQYRFRMGGRLYEGSTKETNPGKARQFESVLMAKIREGGKNALDKRPTLAEFSKEFLAFIEATQGLKPESKHTYRNGWKRLSVTPIAKLRLNEIGPADAAVLKFPGVSGSTANAALRTLSRMLSFAAEKDWIKATPVIKLRKENKRTAIIEDVGMETTLLGLAGPTLRDVMIVMLDCGMRPDEVVRMRKEHISWDRSAILIPDSKTEAGSGRYVPMSERMAEMLRGRKGEWVFPSIAQSGHTDPTSVSGNMWQSLKAAYEVVRLRDGLPELPKGLVLYSCRHTFATNFLKASGNDRAALKEIMGHSSFAITERYVHPGITGAAAVMDNFNKERRKLRVIKEA